MKKILILLIFLFCSAPIFADTVWLGPTYFLSTNNSTFGVSMKTDYLDGYLGYANQSTSAAGYKTATNSYLLIVNGKLKIAPKLNFLLGAQYGLDYDTNYNGNTFGINTGLQYNLTNNLVLDLIIVPLSWTNQSYSGIATNIFNSGTVMLGASYLFPVHPVYNQ